MNSTRLKISTLLIITQIINAGEAPKRPGTPPLSPRSVAARLAALPSPTAARASTAATTSASAPSLTSPPATAAAPAGTAPVSPKREGPPRSWRPDCYVEFPDGTWIHIPLDYVQFPDGTFIRI